MHCDSTYIIGKSHQVCQDYAKHGDGYCLISDGCSSSPHTDVGSRLLVLAAEQIMRDMPDFPWEDGSRFYEAAAVIAAVRAKEMGLPIEAIDATLHILRAEKVKDSKEDSIHAFMYGDGVIASYHEAGEGVIARDMKKETSVFQIIFDDNCPDYPSYLLNADRDAIEKRSRNEAYRIRNGEIFRIKELECERQSAFIRRRFSSWNTKFVAIFSDGIASMTERVESETSICQKPVPAAEVIQEMLAFKNFAGQFVQRRVQAFLRECKIKGREFSDDVSIAVMKFD